MICVLFIAAMVVGVVIAVVDGNTRRRNQAAVFPALIQELEAAPLDPNIHTAFLQAIRSLPLPREAAAGQPAYDAALRILEDHPSESRCKQLALAVGRWHFGRGRPNGLPTTYDEQAILNDILVRTQIAVIEADSAH